MSDEQRYDPEFDDAIPKAKPRRGFRIGELMVVVAIVAVLIALLLPAIRSSSCVECRPNCLNNLKCIGLAIHNYEQEYGTLPPAYTVDAKGRRLHSWRTLILPYLDQVSLYRAIDLSKPWDDPVNKLVSETVLPVYRCPLSKGSGNATTYLAVVSEDACFRETEPRKLEEITDQHGDTLMVIEAGEENAVPWMKPVDADEALVLGLGAKTELHHPGGMNALFVDGSVRFLKAEMPAEARRAMVSISGNDDEIGRGSGEGRGCEGGYLTQRREAQRIGRISRRDGRTAKRRGMRIEWRRGRGRGMVGVGAEFGFERGGRGCRTKDDMIPSFRMRFPSRNRSRGRGFG